MVCVIFAVKMNTLDHLLPDIMISKMHYSVYYNNRTEKLIRLEPKKIQKSDENLRAELTYFANQTTQCLRLNKIYTISGYKAIDCHDPDNT